MAPILKTAALVSACAPKEQKRSGLAYLMVLLALSSSAAVFVSFKWSSCARWRLL